MNLYQRISMVEEEIEMQLHPSRQPDKDVFRRLAERRVILQECVSHQASTS